jgi:hypothetical protein
MRPIASSAAEDTGLIIADSGASARRWTRRLTSARTLDIAVACLALVGAAVPVLRMWHVVVGTVANTVANDYILYIDMIRHILQGTYHWQNFFYDTFMVGSHFLFFPILIRIAIIDLTHWNTYFECYVTFILALVKVALLYALYTFDSGNRRARWVLLPVIAALTFSTSQVDTFTYGDAGMQIQLNQVGFVLGVYGLVRYPDTRRGLVLMAAGGVLATWSGGAGLPAWPVFLLGLLAFWTWNWKHLAVYAVAAAVALWPYVFFVLVDPKPWTGVVSYIPYPRNSSLSLSRLLNWPYFLVGFGWPFDQDRELVVPLILGFFAVCLWIWSVVSAFRMRFGLWPSPLRAGVLVSAYGVLNVVLTMGFRDLLQPWYTTHYLPIWLGFVGIGWAYFRDYFHMRSRRLWLAVLTGIAVVGYAGSDVTYADKALLAYMRSPATASCLRNAWTAPLTCGQFVFNWGPVMRWFPTHLAAPLKRYRLANYAPDETWALQGDFALENVKAVHPDLDNLVWSADQGTTVGKFQDFQRLNLVLRAGNSITWLVRVPDAGARAVLGTEEACGSVSNAPASPCGYAIQIGWQGQVGTRVTRGVIGGGSSWTDPIAASLARYAGRVVQIRLLATGPEDSWTAFKYPTVHVYLPTSVPVTPSATWHYVPAQATGDGTVAGTSSDLWRLHGLSHRGGSLVVNSRFAYLTYRGNLSIQLGRVRVLTFQARMSGLNKPRGFSFEMLVNHETSYRLQAHWFAEPVSSDGRKHAYAVNVDVAPFHAHDVLTELRIEPMADVDAPVGSSFRISDIRFVRSVKLVRAP